MTAVPYLGVHEAHSIAETQQRFPGVTVTGPLFVGKVATTQNLWTKISNICASAWAAGVTPAVTFKLAPSEVNSGLWDAQLSQVHDGLAAGNRSALVYYWHEPEDDMTGATFVAATNRIYSILHDASGAPDPNPQKPPTGVKRWLCGYAAGSYEWRPSSTHTADPTQWEGVTADFFSCDVYSGNSFPATAILPEHTGFARWRQYISPGMPFLLTERGFQAPSSQTRVDTINRETAWLDDAAVPVLGYIYWNTVGSESDPDWVLDAPGEAAVANLIHQLSVKS